VPRGGGGGREAAFSPTGAFFPVCRLLPGIFVGEGLRYKGPGLVGASALPEHLSQITRCATTRTARALAGRRTATTKKKKPLARARRREAPTGKRCGVEGIRDPRAGANSGEDFFLSLSLPKATLIAPGQMRGYRLIKGGRENGADEEEGKKLWKQKLSSLSLVSFPPIPPFPPLERDAFLCARALLKGKKGRERRRNGVLNVVLYSKHISRCLLPEGLTCMHALMREGPVWYSAIAYNAFSPLSHRMIAFSGIRDGRTRSLFRSSRRCCCCCWAKGFLQRPERGGMEA